MVALEPMASAVASDADLVAIAHSNCLLLAARPFMFTSACEVQTFTPTPFHRGRQRPNRRGIGPRSLLLFLSLAEACRCHAQAPFGRFTGLHASLYLSAGKLGVMLRRDDLRREVGIPRDEVGSGQRRDVRETSHGDPDTHFAQWSDPGAQFKSAGEAAQ